MARRQNLLVQVPQSFRDMPRWWSDVAGRQWLDRLPRLVADQCRTWGLQLDGPVRHGSNALVVPVRRGAEELVLRMSPPGDDVGQEASALQFWNGQGTVKLIQVDLGASAMLLERLNPARSLAAEPLDQAVPVIARFMRRLARPAPPHVSSTDEIAATNAVSFPIDWQRLGRPTTEQVLRAAVAGARRLSERATGGLAVNGDLHYDQVLAATREPWLVVDPVLMRGDIEYDLGRILWSRLDEMATDAEVLHRFDQVVTVAGLDADCAREWVIVRSMDYLHWGLDHDLTFDPERCKRLLTLFV